MVLEPSGRRIVWIPLIRGRALIGGASNSAVNQLVDELVGAPGRVGIAYAPLRCDDPRCSCRFLQPPARLGLQQGHTTGGGQSSNVLQHRLTPSPFVVGLMGAQAVAHRHADHIIAVPDSVRSQAVAVAE